MVLPDEEAQIDLDVAITYAIEYFVEDFQRKWGLGENEPPDGLEWERWYEILALNATAERIVAAVLDPAKMTGLQARDMNWPAQLAAAAKTERAGERELIDSLRKKWGGDERWPQLENVLRWHLADPDQFKERFFDVAVQTHLAESSFLNVRAMAARLTEMVPYLVRDTDPRVLRMIERVTRCHLLGMVPELAVMSRAVMEIALETRLPIEYMRRVLELGPKSRIPLLLWIEEASDSGYLDEAETTAAKDLWDWGGKAAHGAELDGLHSTEILEALQAVLTALLKEERP